MLRKGKGFLSKPNKEINSAIAPIADLEGRAAEAAYPAQASPNHFIFSNLTQHQDWSRFAKKSDLTPIKREFLRYLLDRVPEDDLRKAAVEFGPTWSRESMLQRFGKVSPNNFVKWIQLYCTHSGLPVETRVGDRRISFTIQNDLGAKWSVFIEALMESTLRKLFGIVPEVQLKPNLIAFSFPKQT